MKVAARVLVTLKENVLDPQGKAIENSLGALGFDTVKSVRQGKIFDIEIETSDRKLANEELDSICKKLLANLVIEDYRIEIV